MIHKTQLRHDVWNRDIKLYNNPEQAMKNTRNLLVAAREKQTVATESAILEAVIIFN